MGQDQVSGGVSVLCWLATPVAMFYGNLQNLVIRSKSVIKSSKPNYETQIVDTRTGQKDRETVSPIHRPDLLGNPIKTLRSDLFSL